MSSLPAIEVFLRADPLEAVVISDPPIEVSQPIFQIINPGNFATAEQGTKADTAVQPAAIAEFETTEQLNARDSANRNRANHSGTQAMETIDGLELELAGKQPAGNYASAAQGGRADSALQPNDNISRLTNNVGFITENIPDGSRIGGVAYFNRAKVNNTGPATRPDGSALLVNDRWWNTTDKIDCFWNGTYWANSQITYFNQTFTNLNATFTFATIPGLYDRRFPFLVESIDYSFTSGAHNASNYFALNLWYFNSVDSFIALDPTNAATGDPGGWRNNPNPTCNTYIPKPASNYTNRRFALFGTRVGSPPTINALLLTIAGRFVMV